MRIRALNENCAYSFGGIMRALKRCVGKNQKQLKAVFC